MHARNPRCAVHDQREIRALKIAGSHAVSVDDAYLDGGFVRTGEAIAPQQRDSVRSRI